MLVVVFLAVSGVVWSEAAWSRQAGVRVAVSVVGWRIRSQANLQSSRQSAQKCMQARVPFSSQLGRPCSVWLAAFTV